MPPPLTEFAPAKVNLCLHVTGRRADGYHLLDSLVVFAEMGDRIHVAGADRLTLTITGPMAASLSASEDNLVMLAARAFLSQNGAALTLEKHLPVASGIGGGSADAAATLRALSRLWGLALPPPHEVLSLGADVPVCLAGVSARMQGVGDRITPLTGLPAAWLVLVNPGVKVATPLVFDGLVNRSHPPLPPIFPYFSSIMDFASFLIAHRNDLEPSAMELEPVIRQVKTALSAQPGCLLARMSGSGATCFGMFANVQDATAAAQALLSARPGWWVAAARMLG